MTIVTPRSFLVANVTARPTNDPEAIRRQLVMPVSGRFTLAREHRVAGRRRTASPASPGFVAGKVLTGMVKRIAPDAEGDGTQRPADIEAFAQSL